MIKVMPSTNPCPEEKLLDYARYLEDINVEFLHCDVMDGIFVENKCLDVDLIKKIRDNTSIGLDVHLMVKDVKGYVDRLLKVKPNIVTFHYEALNNIRDIIRFSRILREKDIMVGIALSPDTDVNVIKDYLAYIDLVLIMSVVPGKSGQKFIIASKEKIKLAKDMCEGYNIKIEVDGGINLDNCKEVILCGANYLVMGNALYSSSDKKKVLHAVDNHY